MKKILLALISILLFLPIISASAAGSSSLSLSGTNKASVGQSVSINIIVNPNGEAIDTVRAIMSYPAELVRIDQIINGSAYPNQAPANTFGNGQISWGGFRINGPNNDSVTFATIKATALKPGNATLAISSARIISNGEEKGSGASGSITVNITEKSSATPASPPSSSPQSPSSPPSSPSNSPLVCDSHPEENVWYNHRELHCKLTNQEGKFDVTLIKDGQAVWETTLSKSAPTFTVPLRDGSYEIQVNGKLARPVLIDTTAPKAFAPSIERLGFGEDVTIYFASTDDMSGIDHYSLSIPNAPEQIITSPFMMKGTHTINNLTIVAWDKAGNSTATTLSIVNREIISWTYWGALLISLLLWAYLLGKIHERKVPRKKGKK